MTTPADNLRDRIAAAIRAESSRVDDVAIADAVLAVLREPVARQVLGTPTTDPTPDDGTPFRYVDADEFCLSARLLPGLPASQAPATVSITVEGSDEPQSAHVPVTDLPKVLAGIARAAGLPAPAPAAPVDRATDRRDRYAAAILDALARDTTRGPHWGAAADAVMAVADSEQAELRAELERLRGLLWAKYGATRRLADEAQPTETEAAPWPSTTQYAVEVREVDDWVGVTYHRPTLAEAQERRDAYRRRFPTARFRIVRWDETATVAETDPEPATAATEEPQP